MIKIGQAFSEERKRKNLTIEEVARATKIKESFLRAIEKGDFNSLPSSAYAHGFVRNYAKFLGLHVEKSLALFRREYDANKNFEVLPKGFTNSREYSPPRFRIGRNLILIFVVFFVLILFLFYQYRAAIFNPTLIIESPRENQTVNSMIVEIKGRTDSNATLIIDENEVPVDKDGSFKKTLTVFPGSATIIISAKNKFGRESKIRRNIIIKPSS